MILKVNNLLSALSLFNLNSLADWLVTTNYRPLPALDKEREGGGAILIWMITIYAEDCWIVSMIMMIFSHLKSQIELNIVLQ